MWTLFGYPPTPDMPVGALPALSRMALSKAEGLHAWESLWRMGLDAGRTEGAMIASACWLLLILFILSTAATIVFLLWLFGRLPRK